MNHRRALGFRVIGSTAAVLAGTIGLYAAFQSPSGKPAGSAKLAEEQFKNIQVMKGVPADQVIPTMQFISASLGVECEFCHETNRTLNTEKKDVARRMMIMTLALGFTFLGEGLSEILNPKLLER